MALFTVIVSLKWKVSEVHILDCRTAGMPWSLIHTSRPREPMQWMWYGTPPACTHPLWHGGEGEGRTYEGRGRYNTLWRWGRGLGVLPYLLCSLPSTAAHICPHVCAYVLTRAYSTCMTGMWPAAVASILKRSRNPWRQQSREHYGSKVEKKDKSKTSLFRFHQGK